MFHRLNIPALALLAILSGAAAHAQTFTVTPAKGPGPFTATWDVPNGTACQASGVADWMGAVASSGTKQVQPAVGIKSLSLACTVPGPTLKGSVTLKWQPASTNEDGTPYINAKDVLIIGEKRTPPTAQIAAVPVGENRYVAENLDAGTWYFGAKSRNVLDFTGNLSPIVSKAITDVQTTESWSKVLAIEVTTPPPPSKPKAPVLSIEQTP